MEQLPDFIPCLCLQACGGEFDPPDTVKQGQIGRSAETGPGHPAQTHKNHFRVEQLSKNPLKSISVTFDLLV